MKFGKLAILISTLVLIAALSLAIYAAFYVNRAVTNTGNIIALNDLNVYSDSACTVPLTTLTWGDLHRNDVVVKTFYMKNLGDQTLHAGWNVTGATGLTFTAWTSGNGSWQVDRGLTITSGSVFMVNMTMTVSGSASIAPFSFTLNVYALDTDFG